MLESCDAFLEATQRYPGHARNVEGRPEAGKVWDESQAAGRKPAVDRGNTFYVIPGAELDSWIKASNGLYDEWTASMDKAGMNGKQMLQDARDLLAKYKK